MRSFDGRAEHPAPAVPQGARLRRRIAHSFDIEPGQRSTRGTGLLTGVRQSAGESDPVNGQLALLTPLAERYRAAGLADVTVRTYPQARHEILNEINNAEVVAAIVSWVDRVLSSASLSRPV